MLRRKIKMGYLISLNSPVAALLLIVFLLAHPAHAPNEQPFSAGRDARLYGRRDARRHIGAPLSASLLPRDVISNAS